jgi:hypothetical protein
MGTPSSAAEHAMVVLKLLQCGQSHYAQACGNGALRWSEDRTEQKRLDMSEDAFGKQRCKC